MKALCVIHGKYILVIIVIINFNLIVVCSVCQRFLELMSFRPCMLRVAFFGVAHNFAFVRTFLLIILLS